MTTTRPTPTTPRPDIATERADDVESAAMAPIEVAGGGHIRIGTASWTDPTMTATRRLLPDVRRRPPRSGSSTTPSTFPLVEVDATYYALPVGRDGRAVGRAHAARLHVRHQGARADDRPGHRDEAPAEGHPRRACRSPSRPSRGSTPRTCRRSCSTRSGRRSATASSRSREAGQLGLDPAPVPALVLPVVGEPGGDRGGGRAPRRDDAARSSSATARGSTRRTPSGRCAS